MKPYRPRSPMTRITLPLLGLLLIVAVILTIPVHADPGILHAAPTSQGNGDCSGWANACTLQHALSIANGGDEIWVKKGVHKPTEDSSNRIASFALRNGVAVYGGFAGTENNRDQRNWQTNLTVLSGDIDGNDTTDANGVVTTTTHISGANSYHIVGTTNVISTAVLDGFVITAGQANGNTWPHFSGGGMLNSFSSPTLRNIIFSGNMAARDGGGMYNDCSNPTLVNVTFSDNTAENGGGMYNYRYSKPTLRNTIFSGNTAGSGGGMYNNYRSSPTLVNATFGDNTAGSGGGMYNVQSSPVLTNVIMWDNSGEISNNEKANPTIAYSDIYGCGGSDDWDSNCGTDAGSNIDFDPLFVNLAGGNLRLQKGSPCIDMGSNAALPPDITTDLDGNPRIADGDENGTPVVDMGAYEVQPPPPTPTTAPTAAPTTAPTTIPTAVATPPHVYLPVVRK